MLSKGYLLSWGLSKGTYWVQTHRLTLGVCVELEKVGSLVDWLQGPGAHLRSAIPSRKSFVLAPDLVSSQEGILSCSLHQKVQYSGFAEWETCCQGWQAGPCVVWSDNAHCFGTSFIQMLNAATTPAQTKVFPKLWGGNSPHTELRSHSLGTAAKHQRLKRGS